MGGFDMDGFLRFAAEVIGVAGVEPATSYGSIPEWDSVQHLRLVMETEARYGVSIPLETVASLKTIADFAALAEKGALG